MGLVVLRPGTTDRLVDVPGFWGRLLAVDYPIVPQAMFGWDPVHSLWIPNVVSPSGTTIEFHAQAILGALTNLLSEMSGEVMSTDAVRAELTKLTGSGSVLRTQPTMPPRQGTVAGQPATAIGLGQGVGMSHDLARLAFDSQRKYLGVDAGQYVSPVAANGTQITFTGQNLTEVVGGVTRWRVSPIFNLTDQMYHTVTAIVDPVGAAVGTMTVDPPIPTANATFRIPFTSTPFFWNSAMDAAQTVAVAANPPRINGPATFISQTAATANATYQFILPCANYGRYGLQVMWVGNGGTTRTLVFNTFGKIDDGAWAGAGAIPAVYNCNTWWQNTAGSTGWGAAAAINGGIVARMADAGPFNSIAVEMVVTNSDANTTTVTAWWTMYGGEK